MEHVWWQAHGFHLLPFLFSSGPILKLGLVRHMICEELVQIILGEARVD